MRQRVILCLTLLGSSLVCAAQAAMPVDPPPDWTEDAPVLSRLLEQAYAAQVASWVCQEAIGLMGHLGTYHANLVEKLYRDVKVYDIFEGTGQVQRIVISRRLLKGL